MGAAQSRRGAGRVGSKKDGKFQTQNKDSPFTSSHLILSYRSDRIKVVNAEPVVLKLLSDIIRRHCQIVKEGWDRHLTFSYRLKTNVRRHCSIQLVADILLSLYQSGWDTMTPLEMGVRNKGGRQTTLCFRRKTESDQFGSTYSILSNMGSPVDNNCLCVETYLSDYLGFHNVPNTVLHELVKSVQQDWVHGVKGISMSVSSVISDYTSNMPPVLTNQGPELRDEKFIQIGGNPWTSADDSLERLQMSIVACMTKEGYSLNLDINLDETSRVFFFIRDKSIKCGDVRMPNTSGAGLGEKDTLCVYRPIVVRSKSSFFRNYHGRTNSIRRKVRASLMKKTSGQTEQSSFCKEEGSPAMTYKVLGKNPAWWQQTSTDMSSDVSDQEWP